jgi:hypothetical protein
MALTDQQLKFNISPIVLTGGLASNITGGMLPFISLTNIEAYAANLLTGDEAFQLEDAFAIFQPAAGGSLVEQQVAEYPFANLSVAGNAIIRNPINLSMIMITPMKTPGAWAKKLQVMQALKATLDQHNNAGGTYTIFTPAYTYTNMLMLSLTDASMASSPLPQNAWKWDFTRPLVSQSEAAGALSNFMSQVTKGVISDGNITGPLTALGSGIIGSISQGLGAGGTAIPFIANEAVSFLSSGNL